MTQQGQEHFDVVLIGLGLASTACARALAARGKRVGIVPGVARSRSPEVDSGLVDADIVAAAFGDGTPLGEAVSRRESFSLGKGATSEISSPVDIPERRTFRRVELEEWALAQAGEAGATYLDGFVERGVLPAQDGTLTVTSEDDDNRHVNARYVVLCEGADPRIAMRAGLRPDYAPEDQIHFARTILDQAATWATYRTGTWRTTWGMPVDVVILPLESGVMVSVAARIENVMRCSRSAVDALDDLISSRFAIEMELTGARVMNGVELVALRPLTVPSTLVHDRMLTSIDGAGVVDPRSVHRFDAALTGGLELAAHLIRDSGDPSWDDVALPIVRRFRSRTRYHDDPDTGFLEEGPGGARLMHPFQRLRRGIVHRIRAND